MITIDEYVGVHKNSLDWNGACQRAAEILLDRANRLIDEYVADGHVIEINPKTGSQISGETYGGFRPQSCPIGAPYSSHKLGMAVDIYDIHNELDNWIDANPDVLVKYDLYREAPISTLTWTHLATKKPLSGRRTFLP